MMGVAIFKKKKAKVDIMSPNFVRLDEIRIYG